jgi:hypothetical protein
VRSAPRSPTAIKSKAEYVPPTPLRLLNPSNTSPYTEAAMSGGTTILGQLDMAAAGIEIEVLCFISVCLLR